MKGNLTGSEFMIGSSATQRTLAGSCNHDGKYGNDFITSDEPRTLYGKFTKEECRNGGILDPMKTTGASMERDGRQTIVPKRTVERIQVLFHDNRLLYSIHPAPAREHVAQQTSIVAALNRPV